MTLDALLEQIPDFNSWSPKEKIKIFIWWLHKHSNKGLVSPRDVGECFAQAHIKEPPALATYLSRLSDGKVLLKKRGGYKLERTARAEYEKRYGLHHSVVAVSRLLSDLPLSIPNVNERVFMQEALNCYRSEAYRACIVMVWNLAYAHLLDWILSDADRLHSFNSTISVRFPKRSGVSISSYDAFLGEFKEREVIEVCGSAGLLNANITKILREKLDRRNICAHPSDVVVVQSQADDAITDLINNVVIQLI